MDIRFTLLRIAIGNDVDTKSFALTGKDWSLLFDFCKRQALLGVGFSAIEKLHKAGIECPQNLLMKWMPIMFGIEAQNKNIICQCKELTEQLEHDGLHCCILKGQGNLLNYPEHLRLRRNLGQYDERGKNMRNGSTIPHAIWKLKRVMRPVSSYLQEPMACVKWLVVINMLFFPFLIFISIKILELVALIEPQHTFVVVGINNKEAATRLIVFLYEPSLQIIDYLLTYKIFFALIQSSHYEHKYGTWKDRHLENF